MAQEYSEHLMATADLNTDFVKVVEASAALQEALDEFDLPVHDHTQYKIVNLH
jgi:hypothetical protein